MKLLFVLFLVSVVFTFPTSMIGYWQGIPEVTPLGPWKSTFNISILPVTDSSSDYLLSDFFESDGELVPGSIQQFWIQDGVGVTYCGLIYDFFRVPGPVIKNFTEQQSTDTVIQWCDNNCELSWTITLVDENTLQNHFLFADPVNHLNVTMKRISSKTESSFFPSITMPPPCNITFTMSPFNTGDEEESADKIPDENNNKISGCPFHHLHNQEDIIEEDKDIKITKSLPREIDDNYEFCFILNNDVEFALAWNYIESEEELQIALSIPTSNSMNTYIGLGFEPFFPGMYDADVALGYKDSNGNDCVRSMYVPYYVGPPQNDDSMVISKTQVTTSSDRLTVEFSRAFDTGHHNITTFEIGPFTSVAHSQIMWAIGDSPTSCTGTPNYHGNNRGLRYIDWIHPSTIFPDFMKCSF